MFNDASQFIQGSSGTVLSIGATDEIDLTATTVDLNGTLNVSGVATFQAAPVFPDGSLAVADLDIDGATDIGAAIVDADLFIVDDGAGGTNRKTTASRLKTYVGSPGWVLVDTQTVSGTPSSVESGAVFSSTYDTYVIVIRRVNFSANGGFQMQIGDSSAYVTSGYRWAGSGVNSGGALVTYSASDSQIDLLGGTGTSYHMNTTQDCLSGVIWVHNPYNSVRTSIHGELAWENATNVYAHINNIAAHPNTGASYDRWKLFPNTGTFQTTTIIQTFGVVNA